MLLQNTTGWLLSKVLQKPKASNWPSESIQRYSGILICKPFVAHDTRVEIRCILHV
jgi:hypothetical protein